MAGMTDLDEMLRSLAPVVRDGRFVYVLLGADAEDYVWAAAEAAAEAVIVEMEGRTLVVRESEALRHGLAYDGVYSWITLQVHSSLQAVGLTAAFSTALAEEGLSCNVLAGYFHDHLLVPVDQVDAALAALDQLSTRQG